MTILFDKFDDFDTYDEMQDDIDQVFPYFGDHYCYMVVDGNFKVVYIGKGSGDRYKHAARGRSSSVELNRKFFNGDELSVYIFAYNMSEEYALAVENTYINLFYQSGHLVNNKPKDCDDFWDKIDLDMKDPSPAFLPFILASCKLVDTNGDVKGDSNLRKLESGDGRRYMFNECKSGMFKQGG